MTAKLHINISQGIIDIEGEAELVREIYADFKEQLLSGAKLAATAAAESIHSSENAFEQTGKPKFKRRAAVKKKPGATDDGSGVSSDRPKLDKHLDTAKLQAFYAQFEPKNHSEKILIFLKFLTDTANVENPNTDQVFTCYKAINEKIPEAFAQAFRNMSSKFGYIELNSATSIPITITGDNHFNHNLKRKGAE